MLASTSRAPHGSVSRDPAERRRRHREGTGTRSVDIGSPASLPIWPRSPQRQPQHRPGESTLFNLDRIFHFWSKPIYLVAQDLRNLQGPTGTGSHWVRSDRWIFACRALTRSSLPTTQVTACDLRDRLNTKTVDQLMDVEPVENARYHTSNPQFTSPCRAFFRTFKHWTQHFRPWSTAGAATGAPLRPACWKHQAFHKSPTSWGHARLGKSPM